MTLCRGIITLGCFLAGASATVYKPDVIQLPTGFFPQGMAIGEDWDVYIGSVGGKYVGNPDLACCPIFCFVASM